jgi:type IV pilus assembly protein PilN
MIRINLLTGARAQTARKRVAIQAGQKITIGCSLILIFAALFIAWRYWALASASASLDADIAAAQQETTRLHAIIQKVQEFEQRRAQLSQRVVLIEQLRRDQTGPVHMLDQVSRALPPLLWLTEIKQTGTDITITGVSTSQTGVSDYITSLEGTGYFKRSIDIVNTTTETLPRPPGELVRFTIKAQFQAPAPPQAAAPQASR